MLYYPPNTVCVYTYIHCRPGSACQREHVVLFWLFPFWIWVTLLNSTLSNSTYFLQISWSRFSLPLNNILSHFIYWPVFYYLFTCWQTSRLVSVPCYHKWSGNKYGCVSIRMLGHGVLWVDARSETADLHSSIFNLFSDFSTDFHTVYWFHHHQQWMGIEGARGGVSFFPTSSLTSVVRFVDESHSDWGEVLSQSRFHLHFPDG